jgi:hypothetical protein
VEPGQSEPCAVGVEQFETGDMQVGRHRAGEPVDPEGAAAMRIRERHDLALAGSRIDGGDDAAHEDDDEQQQHADRDAQPFGGLPENAHQKACPIPM